MIAHHFVSFRIEHKSRKSEYHRSGVWARRRVHRPANRAHRVTSEVDTPGHTSGELGNFLMRADISSSGNGDRARSGGATSVPSCPHVLALSRLMDGQLRGSAAKLLLTGSRVSDARCSLGDTIFLISDIRARVATGRRASPAEPLRTADCL